MRRTLQELTFKDNFLFAATMMDPENCRLVLERILDMEIQRVEVSYEKSLVYHPEYKGVRLDVFAKDGTNTVFLSTKGKNDDEVPKELVKFLKFVKANLSESTKDFEDDLVLRLQRTIEEIKSSREMGAQYMLFEEIKKEEFRAGKIDNCQENILELLDEYEVSEVIVAKVRGITNLDVLKKMFKFAARAQSIEEFETEMECLLEEFKV